MCGFHLNHLTLIPHFESCLPKFKHKLAVVAKGGTAVPQLTFKATKPLKPTLKPVQTPEPSMVEHSLNCICNFLQTPEAQFPYSEGENYRNMHKPKKTALEENPEESET